MLLGGSWLPGELAIQTQLPSELPYRQSPQSLFLPAFGVPKSRNSQPISEFLGTSCFLANYITQFAYVTLFDSRMEMFGCNEELSGIGWISSLSGKTEAIREFST